MRRAMVLVCCFALNALRVDAGTTGALAGRIVDAADGRPVAGATVTASSPSQTALAVTDASGAFTFASLAPDTYAVGVVRTGYEPQTEPGISIYADQSRTANFSLTRSIRTIAEVKSRSPSLLRPGTTGDVYSVNAQQARSAATLTGSGSLNQAYSAIASVAGAVVPQGQQGWYQFVYIRGGAQDQDGWELDGIPVNRAYDNAPQTMLSSLGQQELQVYTGGAPATSVAPGIAGYVNQVVKTGTYPGYADLDAAAGAPTFAHTASFEIGGATPDRRLSYYFGTLADDRGYRYLDQTNGAGNPHFFYPLSIPTNNGYVYDGSGPAVFSPGNSYGIASAQDRETIANVHLAIPHRASGIDDDVQLLFDTGRIAAGFYSSTNELGVTAPLHWADGVVYTGPLMQPRNDAGFSTYFFPSSPVPRAANAPLPASLRDTNANGFSTVKLQYQHTMSSAAYIRLFGYALYSDWFEYGPVSANLPYGDAVADYENVAHTGGLVANAVDQAAPQHLLTLSGSWSSSTMMRYSTTGGFPAASPNYLITSFVGNNGRCYDAATGDETGCYDSQPFAAPSYSCGAAPPPACAQRPRWLQTEGGYHANLDTVSPRFTGVALNDYWSPSERFSANVGVRAQTYDFGLADTQDGYPARAFWFAAYDREFCFGPALAVPVHREPNAPCPPDTAPVNMRNASGGSLSSTQWQPRLAAAYTAGANDVFRASWGVYTQPPITAWLQFDTVQQDLARYLGTQFLAYGFNTPVHDLVPERSYDADVSWEHRVRGTSLAFKLTPFYRSTADQLQSFDINPLTGLRSGLNVGRQVSAGLEFQAQFGDASRDGWSGQLAYTYTHSAIRYSNFSNGRNVIDNLNAYVQQYNSYTKACAHYDARLCGPYSGNARPAFDNGGTIVANPYYALPAQPLLDRNAWYPVYDVIPAPFTGANGHETPSVASLVVNYKHGKLAVTPAMSLSSGAEYGSPLVWPGYVPQFCSKVRPGTHAAIGSSCAGGPASVAPLPYIFTPDPYTGVFDALGAFAQPVRLTANLQLRYDLSPRVSATVELTDLVDHCYLRGYAWESAGICTYAELPSSALAPAGNFVPAARTPAQLRYPYGMWLNNTEVGALGTAVPFQATFGLRISF